MSSVYRLAFTCVMTVCCAGALAAQCSPSCPASVGALASPITPTTTSTPTQPAGPVLPTGIPVASPGPSTSNNSPAVPAQQAASPDLRIGSGDLLQISVFGASDFNSEVRVAQDGAVSLPLVGTMPVAGMTALECANALKKRLVEGGYFNDPQVSVFVEQYATQGVSVLGEVQKPGIYPLLGSRQLFDLISAAQGTTPLAGDKVTITHRNHPEQPDTVTLTHGKGSSQNNVAVYPGDTIVVEKAGLVYVVGNVQRPTGIVMANPDLTVLQALAMAQGAGPGAALNKAKLVRKTSQGPKELPLPLNKILAAKAPDVKMQPDDVLFVPGSAAKSAGKRGLEAAVTAASNMAIYRWP